MARLLTVTPNPAIDVTYTVPRQVLGETVRVSDVQRRPGGKGLNVARIIRALGREVRTLQPLGGDAGRWIADALEAAGLPVIPCSVSAPSRTTVAIVDGISHPTLYAEPGAGLSRAEWDALTSALRTAAGPGDWVVIAGSFPPGASAEDLAGLIRAVHARGARVAVDTSGPLLLVAAEAGADIVKANESEILEATGAADRDAALGALGRRGATVIMSLGSRGMLLREPTGEVHHRAAVPGVEGNPTGAGDAATAGFLLARAEGHDAATALVWATLCGAAAVLNPVAGEIDAAVIPGLAERAGLPPASPLPLPSERSTS
jgi:1-phosphofructokinase family hexose kinase